MCYTDQLFPEVRMTPGHLIGEHSGLQYDARSFTGEIAPPCRHPRVCFPCPVSCRFTRYVEWL